MYGEFFPMLATRDLGPMLHFYRDLLGFEQTYQFPPDGEPGYVGLRLGVAELGIGAGGDDTHGEPGRMSFCIYAHDCVEAVGALPGRRHRRPRRPRGSAVGRTDGPGGRPRRQRRGDHAAAPSSHALTLAPSASSA